MSGDAAGLCGHNGVSTSDFIERKTVGRRAPDGL